MFVSCEIKIKKLRKLQSSPNVWNILDLSSLLTKMKNYKAIEKMFMACLVIF